MPRTKRFERKKDWVFTYNGLVPESISDKLPYTGNKCQFVITFRAKLHVSSRGRAFTAASLKSLQVDGENDLSVNIVVADKLKESLLSDLLSGVPFLLSIAEQLRFMFLISYSAVTGWGLSVLARTDAGEKGKSKNYFEWFAPLTKVHADPADTDPVLSPGLTYNWVHCREGLRIDPVSKELSFYSTHLPKTAIDGELKETEIFIRNMASQRFGGLIRVLELVNIEKVTYTSVYVPAVWETVETTAKTLGLKRKENIFAPQNNGVAKVDQEKKEAAAAKRKPWWLFAGLFLLAATLLTANSQLYLPLFGHDYDGAMLISDLLIFIGLIQLSFQRRKWFVFLWSGIILSAFGVCCWWTKTNVPAIGSYRHLLVPAILLVVFEAFPVLIAVPIFALGAVGIFRAVELARAGGIFSVPVSLWLVIIVLLGICAWFVTRQDKWDGAISRYSEIKRWWIQRLCAAILILDVVCIFFPRWHREVAPAPQTYHQASTNRRHKKQKRWVSFSFAADSAVRGIGDASAVLFIHDRDTLKAAILNNGFTLPHVNGGDSYFLGFGTSGKPLVFGPVSGQQLQQVPYASWVIGGNTAGADPPGSRQVFLKINDRNGKVIYTFQQIN